MISCIVYVPTGSPSIVVAESPLMKLMALPDTVTLLPPPVTTQLLRSFPSLEVIVIAAPRSSSPATVSFLLMSTVAVTGAGSSF